MISKRWLVSSVILVAVGCFAFTPVLGITKTAFNGLFGVVGPTLLVFLLVKNKLIQSRLILGWLGIWCFAFLSCAFVWWQVEREVAAVIAELENSSAEVRTTAHIAATVKKKYWLASRLVNVEIEPNGYIFYYFILVPSITHWYGSIVGSGHSDD